MRKKIDPDHPIKEFAEELEPEVRMCLFCQRRPPDSLPTKSMYYKNRRLVGWYSNGGIKDGVIARFYLCRNHFGNEVEAWGWVREGFALKKQ
jgi:hypothetical protein